MTISRFYRLLRPKHWVKNLLVFLPALFSGSLGDPGAAGAASLEFASFCCAASAVYVLNDLRDVERDRANPAKRRRPIASGEVSSAAARVILAALALAAAALQVPAGSPPAAAAVALYVALNVAYSVRLKHVPIADVCVLAAGYLLRVYCGALACGIHVSSWLYLTVLAGSFYMGLGKRRGELISNGEGSRPVLGRYGLPYLEKNMYLFLGLANVFYALWARDAAHGMLATVPIAMVLSMRYSLDVERASDGDPMEVIASDGWLVALAAALVAMTAALVYAGPLIPW